MKTYWNVRQKSSGELMLGLSCILKSDAEKWCNHYINSQNSVNEGRIINGFPPLPDDNYEVVQTTLKWTF